MMTREYSIRWWVICLHSHSGHSMSDARAWSPDHSHSRNNRDAGVPGRAFAPLLSWGAPVRHKGPEREPGIGCGQWGPGNISPVPGDLSTLSIKGGNLGNFKFHVMWETIFWIRVMMILFNRQRPFKFLLTSTIFSILHTHKNYIYYFFSMYIFLILIWEDNYPAIMLHKMWHLTHLSQLIKIF